MAEARSIGCRPDATRVVYLLDISGAVAVAVAAGAAVAKQARS